MKKQDETLNTLNSLRDSLDEMMTNAKYSKKYILHVKTLLRKIIEEKGGNIQQ